MFIFMVFAAIADPSQIRLNQIGFYPDGPKTAIVIAPATWYFSIRSTDLQTTYFTGELSPQSTWSASGEKVKCADFSSFTRPGRYIVFVNGIGASFPFTIGGSCLAEVTRGLLKAFYYQRASTALPAPYAGAWSRPAGHPDTRVEVHPSAASDPQKPGARRTGDFFPSPKGWYDAGDYGKYVVNAGISTYELLLLYERFPGYFDTFGLNLPESQNTLPDILDEIKWELDWLLTMQDGADGGVYHKLTSKNFCGDIMPAADHDTRFFIGKGAAATFDFAAVLATAYRVYKKHLPAFADSCLVAAARAWEWGSAHPDSAFSNPPDVVTGEYGDRTMSDELQWAAFELFISSGDSTYLRAGKKVKQGYGVPVWQNVGMLGCYSLALRTGDSASKAAVLGMAATLAGRTQSSPYRTSIIAEFEWGSNGVVANQGTCMVIAYLLTKDINYLAGAIHACDYLLGRNAIGYSFVTGYGSRAPMHPHHRPSTADDVANPVPGLLSGGPNAQAGGEGCPDEYPKMRAQKWLDRACSYTSNEIAINWNAPAAFLAGSIEALISADPEARRALRDRYYADTVPPASLTLKISGVRSDRAIATWKAFEPAAVTISFGPADAPADHRKIICRRTDSSSVSLPGLRSATVYHIQCSALDGSGNTITVIDSFRTETGTVDLMPFFRHSRGSYVPESPLTVSVFRQSAADPIDAKLLYTKGGSGESRTTAFVPAGDSLIAVILAADVAITGISYTMAVTAVPDTFTTPNWSVAPVHQTLTTDSTASAARYRLVCFPGLYSPRATPDALAGMLGNTADWRYFGYDAVNRTYAPFDSLHSGHGGWLYHKNPYTITWSAQGIPPDTLFPLLLRAGWNCIGNPFPFPIYWDNILIENGSSLIPIADPAATAFVRRQYFYYNDTLSDNINNGGYLSNRKLDSHAYDTSAQLHQWDGCWIFAERDSVIIRLNPLATLFSAPSMPLRKKLDDAPHGWYLTLQARSGENSADPAVFGASEVALDGYDEFDSPVPPPVGSRVRMHFAHPDWRRATESYASDIIAFPQGGAHRWLLSVSFFERQAVSIGWHPTGTSNGSISFIDPVAGSSGLVSDVDSYSFTPARGETSRTIEFAWSPEQFASPDSRIPSSWSFTRIPDKDGLFAYTVPRMEAELCLVAVKIYDIRGRCVRILRSGPHAAGSYEARWNRAADRTAPGMYIARLSAAPFSKNIALYIVK